MVTVSFIILMVTNFPVTGRIISSTAKGSTSNMTKIRKFKVSGKEENF